MDDSDSDSLNHRIEGLDNLSNYSDKSDNKVKQPTSIYSTCQHARPDVVEPIYEAYRDTQVILCGPEYTQDYTFFLMHQCKDLMDLER
jgi:hypothetical protein